MSTRPELAVSHPELKNQKNKKDINTVQMSQNEGSDAETREETKSAQKKGHKKNNSSSS
jgi:hypothetical protein